MKWWVELIMKVLSNKPKEVSLFTKLLYLELIGGLLKVYDEYDPMAESMYIFGGIFIGFGLVFAGVINNFSKGDKDAYDAIKSGSYIIIAILFAITFLLVDEPIQDYLRTHSYFILFAVVAIINIVWLNSKAVKNWFTGQ